MTQEQGLRKILDVMARAQGLQFDTAVLWFRDETGHLKIEVLRSMEKPGDQHDV